MKILVVCVDQTKDCLDVLKTLSKKINLKNFQAHLVHIYVKEIYNVDLAPWSIPLPEQEEEIENNVLDTLRRLADDLNLNSENVKNRCFFAFSREQKIKEYLIEQNAEMVVVATRGRHGIEGFFYSSLADYLCKYSPCDVLVLRPKK